MEERRRAKRMPIKMSLEINNIYKQDNIEVTNLHAPVEITNLSKTGLGFVTKSELPLDYYFTAHINLGNEETLHCVVKIVRCQKLDNEEAEYGCEFIGMADVLSYIFDAYDNKISEVEEQDNQLK